MSATQRRAADRRCICGHHEGTHVFHASESICADADCPCAGFHLWEVALQAPCGTIYRTSDVAKFVRDHPHLFEPDDIKERHMPSDGATEYWTKADRGLYTLTCGRSNSWKGWTVCTFPKTFRPPAPLRADNRA